MARWYCYRILSLSYLITRYVLHCFWLVLVVMFLFLKFFWRPCMAINVSVHAGRPGSSEVPRNPDTLGREFDPGKRDFLTKKKYNKKKGPTGGERLNR